MAGAETLRIATYNADLTRRGPGLLLRDILRGDDVQIAAVVAVIARADPDVILLTGFDWDYDGVALAAFAKALTAAGANYPYRFAARPNTGLPTGLDLDRNGDRGDARDAQGYGRFAGEGGMALLSRLPIDTQGIRDYSGFLWRDLPGALIDGEPPDVLAVQRLSTTAHWDVPILLPNGALHLLAWHATPPVFDGPEDRNGRRNHDEAAFWTRYLDGDLPMRPPDAPFVILGDANLDPVDGEGLRGGITALLTDPRLQDPEPKGQSDRADPAQRGDAALDTALFDGIGGLRVDVVLPSADLTVTNAGVSWPPDTDPMAATAAAASRHRLVWVDVALP
ncbi:MAG: endonuclease/exonuclease/phosphatase family protein [Pseudomonadota bacterium]